MATKKATTTKKVTFLDKVLKEVNKSEKDIQKEVLSDRIEDFQVECATQISFIETSQIPGLKNELSRAKRAVANAKKDLKIVELDVASTASFGEYVERLNNAETELSKCESDVCGIESKIGSAQSSLKGFEAILERLKS